MAYTQDELDIKKAMFADLHFLTKHILGYTLLTNDIHKDLCGFVQEEGGDLLILEPRDHFKTTCASVGLIVWLIINFPDIKILLNCKRLAKSREILGVVMQHFESNPRLRYFIGNWIGDPWKDDAMTVNKRKRMFTEPTVAIGGTDHEATGGHYNVIINDDLAGLKDKYSEAERRNVQRYFKSLLYLRDKGNFLKEVTIGTRWHPDDVYNYIMKNREGLKMRLQAAILDDGTPNERPYFPERYSMKELRKLQKEDAVDFAAQMMNNAIAGSSTTYKHGELRFFSEAIKGGTTYAYLDPAMGKNDKSCFPVLITGRSVNKQIYIVDCFIKRVGAEEMKSIIIDHCRKHDVRVLGVEDNQFQAYYAQDIQKALKIAKLSTSMVPITHHTDKDLRIRSVHGIIVDHVHFWADWEEKYPQLIQQLLGHPEVQYKDGPDALEGLISMLEGTSEARIRFI